MKSYKKLIKLSSDKGDVFFLDPEQISYMWKGPEVQTWQIIIKNSRNFLTGIVDDDVKRLLKSVKISAAENVDDETGEILEEN